jgi:hypothetical protein
MPNSEALATATQFQVHGALQRWLATLIEIEGVEVTAQDAALVVTVSYRNRGTGERRVDLFSPDGIALAAGESP